MLRYLEIAGVKIPLYSLMIVIGVIFGGLYFFLVTFKEEKFSKLTLKRFFIAIVLSAICLVIGAALFDSLFHSIEEGTPVVGGITWLGGVVVGFPSFVLLTHLLIPEAKGKALKFVSLIIPSIVLAHAFGRIGCFCGGCCYGKVTDSIFGVKFPFLDVKVLPTQLFESIFDFILFTLMAVFRKRIKYHNFEIYFITYGIFRFFNEFLRGDDRGATSSVLSPAQLLSIGIVIAGIIIIHRYVSQDKIYGQLAIDRREKYILQFASKEEYKLNLSWRNCAIILTSLTLILFLTSCTIETCGCAGGCGWCVNCACPGCWFYECMCNNNSGGYYTYGAQADAHGIDTEETKEAVGAVCSCGGFVCGECGNTCQDICSTQVCDENGNVIAIASFIKSIKNTLSALLSFASQIVYYK